MTFIELVEKFNSGIGDLAKEELLENFLLTESEQEKNYLFWWFNYGNLGIKFRKLQKYLEKDTSKQTALFCTKHTKPQMSDFPVFVELYKTRCMPEADFLINLANLIKVSPESDSQALTKVIVHPLIGIGLATINKIWNKLYGKDYFTPFGIMKAFKFSEEKFKLYSDSIAMEEKYDGIRCVISIDEQNNIIAKTSNGNEFMHFPQFMKDELIQIKTRLNDILAIRGEDKIEKFCIDSELVTNNPNHTESRQRIAGIGNKLLKNTSLNLVDNEYMKKNGEIRIFSTFFNSTTPVEGIKLEVLRHSTDITFVGENLYFKPAKLTWLTETDYQERLTKLMETFNTYISNGREGVIVKDMSKPYELRRSWSWMKLKEEKTADCIITGCFEGNGAKAGMLGCFTVELNQDGKHITASVGSGFSDIERTTYWKNRDQMIGKIVELKYNDLIKSANSDTYSFFLPIFKCIREDKNETNLD